MTPLGRGALALGMLLLVARDPVAQSPEAAPPAGDQPLLVSKLPSPRLLLADVPDRLGGLFARTPVEVRESDEPSRARAWRGWIDEVFAPLAAPGCPAVLAAFDRAVAPPDPNAWMPRIPEGLPVVEPRSGELLVPSELPAQGEADRSHLHTFGLLPYEVRLSGEWARAVASAHSGPPAKDPTLRAARAARLEGVARLAGIVVALQAGRVPPTALGAALLEADAGHAGWSSATIDATGLDPVARALLEQFSADGLRWATVQFLSGRWEAVFSALEKPGLGLESLLGSKPQLPAAQVPEGACRLGPRGAAALLFRGEPPSWIDQVTSDWSLAAKGKAALMLKLESAEVATRAAAELAEFGFSVSVQDRVVTIEPRAVDTPPLGS